MPEDLNNVYLHSQFNYWGSSILFNILYKYILTLECVSNCSVLVFYKDNSRKLQYFCNFLIIVHLYYPKHM